MFAALLNWKRSERNGQLHKVYLYIRLFYAYFEVRTEFDLFLKCLKVFSGTSLCAKKSDSILAPNSSVSLEELVAISFDISSPAILFNK